MIFSENRYLLFGIMRSAFQRFGRHDLDAEAAEADVGALAGCEQADRGNAEVFENLRAEADLAPLPRTGGFGAGVALVRNFRYRHAGGAVAQIDDDAAAGRLELRERGADRLGAAEHVADHIGAMQPRQHALAVADLAIDEGHVVHAVEWGDIGVAVERADF